MAKYNFQISYAPSRPRSSRRTATAASVTSVAAAPAVDISGKLDKAEFYKYFEEVNIGTAEAPVYATRSKRGLFSDSFVSALGLNPNTGGGGGGGATALSELSDVQLSGLLAGDVLIYDGTHWANRPQSSIVPDLSEYATRTWVQQQGYATTAALTAHAGDTALHVSASERTLWNRTATDFAAIVGADSDQIINKWEEVVAFLDTYTEADTLANLLSNKVDKVEGYGLSKNDFTDALLSKLNGIEAGANRYVHPTGGADAAIDDAAGRVLAGITVNALGHVTSVSSKTLAAADIPTLSISKVSGLQDALDGKLDAATFDDLFEKVNIGTTSAPKYAIRAKYGLYADGFLSSLGLNSSGGGGTGGGSYDRLDAWADYTAERAGWVLSAGLGYDLYNRVRSLEGGSALSFTDEGAGNVVTAVKKSGTAVIVTKGLTALTSHQPIYALNFQAGAFEAKKYTPNTGAQTVNIPTKTSHLSNDSGFITSAALTGYATQSWVKGLGYITASALTPYITAATANATFATKLGVSGNQIGTYVNGKLGNLITVPYAANADMWTGELLSSFVMRKHYTLNLTSLPNTNFYPVVFTANFLELDCDIRSQDGVGSAAYNMNHIHFLLKANGWTDMIKRFVVLSQANYQDEETTIGAIGYGDKQGAVCVWLRGGLQYYFISNRAPSLKTTDYTYGSEIYTVGTALSGGANQGVTIVWQNDGTRSNSTVALQGGNVASATKLKTARTLWGQSFDGSKNISGDMSGVGTIFASGNITVEKSGSNPSKIIVKNANGTISIDNTTRRGLYDDSTARWLIGTNGVNTFLLAGNIGFGTQTPSYKVDVNGSVRATSVRIVGSANAQNSYITADATYDMYFVANSKTLLSLDGNQAAVRCGTSAAGTITLGTSSVRWKGVYANSIDAADTIHAATGIWSDGYVSAKGQNTASDMRLKRRIADVALTVKDVAEAPVYRFAWINGGGIDVGSTAQYWAARVPELTHRLPDGIHLGLDYGKAALLSVVAVARATADHERRIADIERQLQNRTI